MQKIIDEYSFYKALEQLDQFSVEINDMQHKAEKLKQAMTELQQDLYNAVAEVEA